MNRIRIFLHNPAQKATYIDELTEAEMDEYRMDFENTAEFEDFAREGTWKASELPKPSLAFGWVEALLQSDYCPSAIFEARDPIVSVKWDDTEFPYGGDTNAS